MDRYNSSQAMDGADPVNEWTAPSGGTGLEEPMWQLGLGSGPESYPERPDEADCIYYLRTGFCGYGARCRFNHPRDRTAAMGAMRAGGGGDYPERVGQPVCQYYMRTGTCKFGASCKYHHPRQGGSGSQPPVNLNVYGYPLRPGEKECSYYVKTGQCKFGVTCKFHHPQPSGVQMPAPAPLPVPAMYPPVQSQAAVQSSQQYGVVSGMPGNWPVPRPALLPGSYLPGPYGPVLLPPGMVPLPSWTSYPAPVSPVAAASPQPTIGAGPIYGITQLSPSAPAYTGQYLSIASAAGPSGSNNQREHAYPERPGQPECMYYVKTGDCKYGASCRYNHPQANLVLSAMGLPLRPGAAICSHYLQNGVCKFGPSCRFDHPMGTLSYSPSASSLADMPVAPYPVGSSMGTLAPSSSSSDLRPDLASGANKEAFNSSRMSSMSGSSGSVGSLYSKGNAGPRSTSAQQGSTAPSGSSSSTLK